jgi:calcineurin-like phosphoesterase family protein
MTTYYPRWKPQSFDWFISDPHFKHENIVRLSKRPFQNIQEMDEMLILNWNRCVQPGQKILCLGDVSLTKDRISLDRIFSRLQGDKYLIAGNHDHWLKHEDLHRHWTLLSDIERFTLTHPTTDKGQNVVFSHFPLWTWEGASRGNWMVHGHCHGNADYANTNTTRQDVGVDAVARIVGEYRPISWRELSQVMDKKKYLPVDHHGDKEEM